MAVLFALVGAVVVSGVDANSDVAYTAWLADSMVRVMPNSTNGDGVVIVPLRGDAPPRLAADLDLAGNEFESIQIALRGGDTNCSLEVVFDGRLPDGLSLRAQQVALVFVTSIYPNSQGGVGWWPDPLLPGTNFFVIANTTLSLWLDVHASPTMSPGTYTDTVTLKPAAAGGCSGAPALSLDLNVTVFGWALDPTLALKTAFNLDQNLLADAYNTSHDGTASHAQWLNYGRSLLRDVRLSPGTIYAEDMLISISELVELRALGLNSFNVFVVPESLSQVQQKAQEVARYVEQLRALNLTQFATFYGFDESDDLQNLTNAFSFLKQAYPDIATFTTAHLCRGAVHGSICPPSWVPEQDPAAIRKLHIDYMCPILDWVRPENITSCEAAGLPMWMYTSLEPAGRYCNLRLDNLLFEARLLFWQIAQLRFAGFLYWGLNVWPPTQTSRPIDLGQLDSPFIDPHQWSPMSQTGTPNDVGDGRLLYAAVHGPLMSTRLLNIRDGLEDHEYMTQYERIAGASALQQLLAPFSDNTDPQSHVAGSAADLVAMRKARRTMGRAIEIAKRK